MASYTVYPTTQSWSGSGLNGSSYSSLPAGSNLQNMNPSNVSSDNQSCSFSVTKSSNDQYFQVIPSSPCAASGVPGNSPTNKGYRSNVCLHTVMQPDGKYSSQDYPLTLTNITVTVGVDVTSINTCIGWIVVKLYAVSPSTGSVRYLTGGNSASASLSGGMNLVSSTVSPSTITLNADEILQLEVWVAFNNNAFLAGTVTGWVGINHSTALAYTAVANASKTTTGTAAGVDSVVRPANHPRLVAETALTADQVRHQQLVEKALADSALAIPSLASPMHAFRDLTDSVSGTDSLGHSLHYLRPEPESYPTTDEMDRAFDGSRGNVEDIPTGPTLGRLQDLARYAQDVVDGVDTISRSADLKRGSNEDAVTVETFADSFKGGRGVSEAIPTTDAVNRLQVLGRGHTETIAAADTMDRRLGFSRPEPENHPTTDGVGRLFVGARDNSEDASTAESVDRRLGLERIQDENVLLTDVLSRIAFLSREPDDFTATSDSTDRMIGFSREPGEVLPTEDALGRVLTQVRDFSEGPADWPVKYPTRKVTGTVWASPGNPYLNGARVILRRDLDGFELETTSSTADGTYEFIRDEFDPYTYSVLSYADQGTATPLQAITETGLVPA